MNAKNMNMKNKFWRRLKIKKFKNIKRKYNKFKNILYPIELLSIILIDLLEGYLSKKPKIKIWVIIIIYLIKLLLDFYFYVKR